MPKPFAPFARRLTTSYVLLAVALIVLVVATTSVLAFLLYVGTLNETIAGDAQRITQRVTSYERLNRPLNLYARELVNGIHGPRVAVRVYDQQRRLLAQSGPTAAPGGLTRAAAAGLGLHPSIVKAGAGTVIVAPDLEGFAHLLGRYLAFVLPIGALAVIVAWLLGRAITRRAVAPLEEVASALRRIAGGDFAPQPLRIHDAGLRELTTAYNDVAHRLTTATVERERNELQMRQFIADAGHELRTPLTIVMGYLEILQQGVIGDQAAVGGVYETMLSQSRRMRAVIEKLILLARLERPVPPRSERIDVAALARRAVEALQPLAGTRQVVVAAPSSPCMVEADESELYEAVKNVLENAIRYAPESPITVDVSSEAADVKVMVSDRGPGMEAQDVEHAFDRFYRGANRRSEGSGLGLAIAKRAVERVAGNIAIESRAGAGTRVTISLPRG